MNEGSGGLTLKKAAWQGQCTEDSRGTPLSTLYIEYHRHQVELTNIQCNGLMCSYILVDHEHTASNNTAGLFHTLHTQCTVWCVDNAHTLWCSTVLHALLTLFVLTGNAIYQDGTNIAEIGQDQGKANSHGVIPSWWTMSDSLHHCHRDRCWCTRQRVHTDSC